MARWSKFCPAKLNLYLAVTGRRKDGFHELVSLVAPLEFGDTLSADRTVAGADLLTCSDAGLSCGPDNLVLKAAAAYRKRVPHAPWLEFRLQKEVPHGAGLGGGSSDAAGALRIINEATGNPLDAAALAEVAAEVGSDCPLFLHNGPLVMRGRGERISPLPEETADALRGRSVLLVKPQFGVPTAWAYGVLAARRNYVDAAKAEADLSAWLSDPESAPPHFNSFEAPIFRKYLAYRALNEALETAGLPQLQLTGSGSALYVFCDEGVGRRICTVAGDSLGLDSFMVQTVIR